MNRILVVCVGNICRSPMAEALFKHALPDAAVCSAGIHALFGAPADPLAVKIMQAQGIDIRSHRARGLTPQMIAAADLILTMDGMQRQHVEGRFPTSRGKVRRLGEFTDLDIGDPYRKGEQAFETAYFLIRQGVEHFTEKLLQLA